MTIYVNIRITKDGYGLEGVTITYKNKTSSYRKPRPDKTTKKGWVKTEWGNNWEDDELEVYYDDVYLGDILIKNNNKYEFELEVNRSGCFSGDTEIKTKNGYARLSVLKEGDFIIAMDMQSGSLREQRILSVQKHPPAQLLEMIFENNKILKVTANHHIMTEKGFMSVEAVQNSPNLQSTIKNFEGFSLKKIRQNNQVETVYNLVVSVDYNFIADGIVAHSFSSWVKPQTIYWNMRQFASSVFKTRSKVLVSHV